MAMDDGVTMQVAVRVDDPQVSEVIASAVGCAASAAVACSWCSFGMQLVQLWHAAGAAVWFRVLDQYINR